MGMISPVQKSFWQSHQARAAQEIRGTETSNPEHRLSMRDDKHIPSGPPFLAQRRSANQELKHKKLLKQTSIRRADVRKEIAEPGGSGG
jgi:hypothetical protein